MSRSAAKAPVALLLAIVLLAACGEDASGESGRLSGHVFAGPTCPVEGPGQDCDPDPWQGTVRATAADGTVFETTSDDAGAYSLALPPGSYVVVADTGEGGPPTGIPTDVTVAAAASVTLDLEVDTGIR